MYYNRYDDREDADHRSIMQVLESIKQKLDEQSRQIKAMQTELLDDLKFDLYQKSTYKELNN